MKPTHLIATFALVASSLATAATPDRTYYVTELVPQQKFDVYNDGRNTYLESIPGLVVIGATADGERFIVNGVPKQIRGYFNGKPITVIRGTPPALKPAPPSPEEVNARLEQLTEKLKSLSTKVAPSAAQEGASAVAATADAGRGRANPPVASSAPLATGKALSDRNLFTVDQVVTYRVAPSDHVMRLVVERWARMVGWTAVWDVEKDIVIGNAGEKTADWKTSVRWLLSSTEFGDLTVKPCFYNNAVVRVVRKTVKCNPNE